MSQKYLYTSTDDDFLSHQDMHADSYQRQSNTYRPSVRSSSQEPKCSTSSNRTVDSPVHLPGMALSFLHSCGLDPSDLAHLAELPEHLITVETLPKLLLQIKESKLSSASSSGPSTRKPLDDTATPVFEGSSHTKSVEYPVDRHAHPVYPLPPEQVRSWQDRWGNPRQFSSLTTGTSGSSSKSSSVPEHSTSKDTGFGPRPLLSLRLEPRVIVPTKKEALDFNCKVPPAFPHACCLCDISVRSSKDWLFHAQSKKHRKRQLELVKKYPKWDQTVESVRRNESSEVYKVPTRKEASDFNGTTPPILPYFCALCKITVSSENDWAVHVTGSQHAKSQLVLMEKYPEWDGTVESSRRNDGHKSTDRRDGTSKENAAVLKMSQSKDELCSRVVSFTPLPSGDDIASELTAIAKCFGSVKLSLLLPNQGYVEMACLAEAKKLVEHYSASPLKLKGKLIQVTFSCEYNSLSETEGNGKTQSRSSHTNRRSSQGRHSIQRESPSPRRRHSSEVTHSSPKRRRSSEKTHSSPKKKRSSERTHSSPKRRHSSERTHSSPKKKRSSERTHSSPKRRHSSERTHSSSKKKGSSERTHSSPKRRRSSERTHSSPKRMHSSERTHSSPKKKGSSERTHSSPQRRRSSEKTHSSPKRRRSSERTHPSTKRRHSSERTHSSRSHNVSSRKSKENSSSSSHPRHSRSAAKNEATKSSAGTKVKRSVSNNCVEMDSGSDLEGLEVIADDGEELVHDTDDHDSTSSDQENLPSEQMDITDIYTEKEEKTGEDSANADTSEVSNSLKDMQKFEEHEDQEIKEVDHDLPKILENCVTLDEFIEETSSDCEESDAPNANASIPKTEQTDESKLPKEENVCKNSAEPSTSENLQGPVDQPKEEQDTERVTDDLKETFGKVIEVRNLPSAEDYTDSDLMNIIKRYGQVTHHVLFRTCKKGFVEMAFASDAERAAADSKNENIALRGNILKIKVSEKYCHLPQDGFSFDSDSDSDDGEIPKESNDMQQSDALNGSTEPLNESNEPIGTEFVRPVVGYFCSLCSVIYASEEEAKDEHCRSPSHHEKVKEHKQKSGYVEHKK